MKFNGPVYMNRCKLITANNYYYNSDNKEKEEEKDDESDDFDPCEVVEVQPGPASSTKDSNSIKRCRKSIRPQYNSENSRKKTKRTKNVGRALFSAKHIFCCLLKAAHFPAKSPLLERETRPFSQEISKI